MFCGNCGKKNPDGMKFCAYCGAPLMQDESVQQAQESAPVQPEQQPVQQESVPVQQESVPVQASVPPVMQNTPEPVRQQESPAPEDASKKKMSALIIIFGIIIGAAAAVIVILLIVLTHSAAPTSQTGLTSDAYSSDGMGDLIPSDVNQLPVETGSDPGDTVFPNASDILPQPEVSQVPSVSQSLLDRRASMIIEDDPIVFTAYDLDGNAHTSGEIFGNADITVVNFWATYCGFCIDEMFDLAEWAYSLEPGVQIIGVVTDVSGTGDTGQIRLADSIMSETGVPYISLIPQDDLEVLDDQISSVPTTIFVNSDGQMVGDVVSGARIDVYKDIVNSYMHE